MQRVVQKSGDIHGYPDIPMISPKEEIYNILHHFTVARGEHDHTSWYFFPIPLALAGTFAIWATWYTESDNICILPVCTSTMPVPKPWLKETSTFRMVCASIFWDSDSCDLHVIQGGFKPGTVHVGCPRPGRPRGPRIKKKSYSKLWCPQIGSFWIFLVSFAGNRKKVVQHRVPHV